MWNYFLINSISSSFKDITKTATYVHQLCLNLNITSFTPIISLIVIKLNLIFHILLGRITRSWVCTYISSHLIYITIIFLSSIKGYMWTSIMYVCLPVWEYVHISSDGTHNRLGDGLTRQTIPAIPLERLKLLRLEL